MSRIIVCREKHGEFYWDASTDELWAAASVKILSERLDYFYYKPDEPKMPEGLLSADEIAALPEPYRKDAQSKVNGWNRRLKTYNEMVAEYDEIVRIVKENDTSFVQGRINEKTGKPFWRKPLAWTFLENRRDYEYEHVELETPTVVELTA